MAVKKISELDTKSFLGTSGAAEHSYVLINYAEGNNDTPVTYKATINELGQAIASNLGLLQEVNEKTMKLNVMSNDDHYSHIDYGKPVYAYVSEDTVIMTPNGDVLPSVVKYNATEDEIGYYSTGETNSWTPINSTAPAGANYILESDGTYYIDGSQIGQSSPTLSAAVVEQGYEDDMHDLYNFVVRDNSGLYYVESGGSVQQLAIGSSGANYIFASDDVYYINPTDSIESSSTPTLANTVATQFVRDSDDTGYYFVIADANYGGLYSINVEGETAPIPYSVVTNGDYPGCITCYASDTNYPSILMATPYGANKYVVVTSTDGTLYYHNGVSYVPVSSLQNV